MVTRIPARTRPVAPPVAGPPAEVLALLAQCLDDAAALDAAASGLLRERADRLMAALASAGLALGAAPPQAMAA